MIGLTVESLPEFWVLGGNSNRTGVKVANSHQNAALNHQRSGSESEFFSSEKSGNYHVSAGLHGTVYLHYYSVPKSIQQQSLLGLGQAKLPRGSSVLQGI